MYIIYQVQGKDPSVDFTQDIIEESEDERCFDEMSDSVPPIELPPCELGRLEEISELVILIPIQKQVMFNLNYFHFLNDKFLLY